MAPFAAAISPDGNLQGKLFGTHKKDKASHSPLVQIQKEDYLTLVRHANQRITAQLSNRNVDKREVSGSNSNGKSHGGFSALKEKLAQVSFVQMSKEDYMQLVKQANKAALASELETRAATNSRKKLNSVPEKSSNKFEHIWKYSMRILGRERKRNKLQLDYCEKRLELQKQFQQGLEASFERKRKPEVFSIKELSKEAEACVNEALDGKRDLEEILVEDEKTSISIPRKKMRCLEPGGWLNDEVINLYLELLKERELRFGGEAPKCHYFNTFFYNKLYSNEGKYNYQGVRRWTTEKKLGYSLLDCDKIFVPVHQQVHWTLAVINMKEKRFEFLDSMYGSDYGCLDNLARYLVDEAKNKRGIDLDVQSWPKICRTDIPEQQNGCDCGVFMVKYADFEGKNAPLSFTQDHMDVFRRKMVWELLNKKIEE